MSEAGAVVLAAFVGAASAIVTNLVTWLVNRRDRQQELNEERRQFLRENLLTLIEAGRARSSTIGQVAAIMTLGVDQAQTAIAGPVGQEHRKAVDDFRISWARIRLAVQDPSIEVAFAAVRVADAEVTERFERVADALMRGQAANDAARAVIAATQALDDALEELVEGARRRLADSLAPSSGSS